MEKTYSELEVKRMLIAVFIVSQVSKEGINKISGKNTIEKATTVIEKFNAFPHHGIVQLSYELEKS